MFWLKTVALVTTNRAEVSPTLQTQLFLFIFFFFLLIFFFFCLSDDKPHTNIKSPLLKIAFADSTRPVTSGVRSLREWNLVILHSSAASKLSPL